MEITWSLQSGRQRSGPSTTQRRDSNIVSAANHENDIRSIIRYDTHYQVQICTEHRYVIRNLARHLASEHALSLQQRKSILTAHRSDVCISPIYLSTLRETR
jgi:hypothetical protein